MKRKGLLCSCLPCGLFCLQDFSVLSFWLMYFLWLCLEHPVVWTSAPPRLLNTGVGETYGFFHCICFAKVFPPAADVRSGAVSAVDTIGKMARKSLIGFSVSTRVKLNHAVSLKSACEHLLQGFSSWSSRAIYRIIVLNWLVNRKWIQGFL